MFWPEEQSFYIYDFCWWPGPSSSSVKETNLTEQGLATFVFMYYYCKGLLGFEV